MSDFEDTARLVLMDLPRRSFGMYARELRAYDPNVSLVTLQAVWDRYMGRDGWVSPTHDLTTGEKIHAP